MFRYQPNEFETIECPDLERYGVCTVVNCIFKHEVKRKGESQETEIPVKRAKTEAPNPEEVEKKQDLSFIITRALTTGVTIPRAERLETAKKIAEYLVKHKLSETPNRTAVDKEYGLATLSKSADEYRRKVKSFLGEKDKATTDPRYIMPRTVNPAPETLPQRKKFIELMVKAVMTNQRHIETPKAFCIDEEFKIACNNPGKASYTHAIKKKIYEISHPEKVKPAKEVGFSKAELLGELRRNVIGCETLEKYGFIMSIPKNIEDFKQDRVCQRCKQAFKLDEVLKIVDCRYHLGKPIKNDHNERIYLCCGGALGATDTEPCGKWNRHVFYWDGPEEMHKALPFVKTKDVWGTKKGSLEAVGIDCEMGYTDRGFELLRITAIDFFTGEEAFDILVKPKGTVIDLNTRWSGVAEIRPDAVTFEDAIALFGEVIDSKTILVGHGLENDMNAMRLIHNKIVDTAILYPRNKTSPTFRYALKNLAFKYLGRNIQAGQHDSGEDSIAAIDITKYFLTKDLERRAEEEKAHSGSVSASSTQTGGAVFRRRPSTQNGSQLS